MILRPIVKLFINAQYYLCLTLSRKKKKGISPSKNGKVEDEDLEDRDAQAIIEIDDSDPLNESKRVEKIDAADLAIKVQNLTKQYTPAAKAVNELSFGLEVGEVFALLGITGAGKTSTFKCLTGEEYADSGSLFLGGNDVKTSFGQL
jgi:ABC-type transport system involved in cytochrome bd biosynthesis fused ATPase/permease subunit